MIYAVKGFGIANKEETYFYGTLLLFDDSTDVGNLISGSFAFSKKTIPQLYFFLLLLMDFWAAFKYAVVLSVLVYVL